LGSLGALFGFELGADRGTFFFFDLLQPELLAFVFFDGATDFIFDFLGSLLEFALGLAQTAGEFRELGAAEQEDNHHKDDKGGFAVEEC